jgi:hypothetical protein
MQVLKQNDLEIMSAVLPKNVWWLFKKHSEKLKTCYYVISFVPLALNLQ